MNINAYNYFYNQFLFYYFSSPILSIFKYLMNSNISIFFNVTDLNTLLKDREPSGVNVALRTLIQEGHDLQASLSYIARLYLNK